MISLTKKITSIAVIALSASTALANDSGLYTKIGVGYGQNQKIKGIDFKIEGVSEKTKKDSAIGEIALGYDISKNFAVDFSFSNAPEYNYNYNYNYTYASLSLNNELVCKQKALNFMINGTYYIDLKSAVRPFITFGLGLGKNKSSVRVTVSGDGISDLSINAVNKKNRLARMIGLGVAMPLSEKISLEGVYKFSTSGFVVSKTTTLYTNGSIQTKNKHLWNHSVMANLKFKF
jgi:opacity protein-like surface antigen